MDKKQLIRWLIPIIARGLAWFFAMKLGLEATQAQNQATAAAEALGALALVGISIYTSVKGRRKLLAQQPAE
ncbi:MAG: hypothetical protein AMJ81_09240 [Phycisphaerae bacterium SM23_33]|nr:MAG: hypothetical protein AMJ81_09240 [Phycisphaerae bacterium SM23_33]